MLDERMQNVLKMRREIEALVASYLKEVEFLNEELTEGITNSISKVRSVGAKPAHSSVPQEIPAEPARAARDTLPKLHIIADIMDKWPERTIHSKHVIDNLRRAGFAPDVITDKDVRRVMSRIAKLEDSPLKLVRPGSGSAPHLYRKIGRIFRDGKIIQYPGTTPDRTFASSNGNAD